MDIIHKQSSFFHTTPPPQCKINVELIIDKLQGSWKFHICTHSYLVWRLLGLNNLWYATDKYQHSPRKKKLEIFISFARIINFIDMQAVLRNSIYKVNIVEFKRRIRYWFYPNSLMQTWTTLTLKKNPQNQTLCKHHTWIKTYCFYIFENHFYKCITSSFTVITLFLFWLYQ